MAFALARTRTHTHACTRTRLTLSSSSHSCIARTISYVPFSRSTSRPHRVVHSRSSVSTCVRRSTLSASRRFVVSRNCSAAGSFSWSCHIRIHVSVVPMRGEMSGPPDQTPPDPRAVAGSRQARLCLGLMSMTGARPSASRPVREGPGVRDRETRSF